MKKTEVEKLLKSYELGQTSSKEEAYLQAQLSNSESEYGRWFSFIRSNKISIPESLEKDIWNTLQSKKKKRVLYRAIAAAASVALLISLFLIPNSIPPQEMSYEEKVAILEEALAMTSPKVVEIQQKVLYEDDIIIIYTETKSNNK